MASTMPSVPGWLRRRERMTCRRGRGWNRYCSMLPTSTPVPCSRTRPSRLHRSTSCFNPVGSAAATARPDQLQTLLEQFVEVLNRAALEQHVPVRAGRLDLFGLRQVTLDQGAFHTVAAQPGAGDFGIVGERHVEFLAVLRAIPRNLAWRQV